MHSVALVFPGIPADSALDEPIGFYDGESLLPPPFLALPGLVTLDRMGEKIDPLTGVVDVGAVTAEVLTPPGGLSDATYGYMVDLYRLLTHRNLEAQGLLSDSITASATSITLYSRGGASFNAGDVIYIEQETVKLNTLTSSDAGDNTQTFTCTRGFAGSRARAHQSNPGSGTPPSSVKGLDNRVYTSPNMRGREVWVYSTQGGAWVRTFVGVMANEPTFLEGSSRVSLDIPHLFTALASRELNARPIKADLEAQSVDVIEASRRFWATMPADEFSQEYGPIRRDAVDSEGAVVQIDSSVVPVTLRTIDGRLVYYAQPITFTTHDSYISSPILGSRLPDLSDPTADQGNVQGVEFAYELLALGTQVVDDAGFACSSIATGNANTYHAAIAWLVHLTSTGTGLNGPYDLLSYNHGLGIPHELIDIAGILDVVSQTPNEGKIHAKFFGWGGKTYTPSQFRSEVLTPFWLYPRLTADGRISLSRLDVVLAPDTTVTPAKIVAFSEDTRLGWDDATGAVSVTYKHPWWDESGVASSYDLPTTATWYLPDPITPELKVDVTALPPDSRLNIGRRQIFSKELLDWVRSPVPVLVFELMEPDDIPFVGQTMRLVIDGEYTQGVFPFRTGARATQATFTGIVTQVKPLEQTTNTFVVELWAVNETLVAEPRIIAPALYIESVVDFGGSGVAICSKTRHGLPVDPFPIPTETNWLDNAKTFYPSSGDSTATTYSILIDTGTALEVDWSGTAPVAGGYIKPKDWDDVSAEGFPFAHYTDIFGSLGAGNDEGHRYV